MKTFFHLFATVGVVLAGTCFNPCQAESVQGNANDKKTENGKNAITAYFSEYLSGKTGRYQANRPIKLSDIGRQQTEVWEAWKKANALFVEEKLIELSPLDPAHSGQWALPAGLEPNATMPYYWGSKGTSRPENGYPLFLYMHGSGDKQAEWQTGIKICQGFKDAPSAYLIPQIPNMGNYYRWWQKSKQFAWEKLLRLAFVSGEIDPNQVYFFGISEGGYGSQRLASFYADYLAAAGPMAGGEPLKNAPVENCRNIAFSLRTGARDAGFYRNKLTQYTKEEFERLQKLHPGNYIHRIELIPGMGHGIDYRPTTPWLKQYVRNPYPKAVNWENFEMDGLYRKGFYNLFVEERSNDDENSRTYYEMDIKDNKISLKVDLVTYEAAETDPHWGIELKSKKHYRPATKGKVIVYLNEKLVDLNKKITLTVNGKKAFQGVVKPELKHLVNSCATFFDPERLYPAAIEVDIADLQ